MSEHKIGDQGVEEIDGKKHMLKALPCKDRLPCHGCDFGYFDMDEQHVRVHTCKCKIFCDDNGQYIIKDLGILNEDGCLPSPWGSYPKIIHEVNQTRIENGEDVHYDNLWCVEIHEPVLVCTDEYLTEQEAIDAWNRRV